MGNTNVKAYLSKYFSNIIFVFFIGLTIILLITSEKDLKAGLSKSDKIFYGFIEREGDIIGKKYQMNLSGVGGGIDKEGIWLVSPHFKRMGFELSEEEARKLIISCVNDYLLVVNSDEKIRPFLKVYPFGPENIDITIFNSKIDGKKIYDPYIGVISAVKGRISYKTNDKTNDLKYKSKKHEFYEESIAILGNSK